MRADATATFHAPKLGLYVEPAKAHAGVVRTIEIGIPRGAPSGAVAGLIAARVLDLFPHRERSGSKFSSGVVVVAGGSVGLTGAPTLAALSAAARRRRLRPGRGARARRRRPSTCACSSR